MALNFENIGQPICIIDGAKTKNIPIISVGDGARTDYNKIEVKEGESLQHIPNINAERDILYVVGQSGSGKSFYCADYCLQYKALYPKRAIYMFSTITDDKGSMDRVKGLKRVNIKSDEFLCDDIKMEDLKESLIIFDDVDCIADKRLKQKIWAIMNSILQTGRHFSISAIITFHIPTAGHDTRMILNECHSITFFPKTLGGAKLKYLLDSYLGLDKKEIARVKKLKSRWITVFKSYPKVILSQKEVFIPASE